MAAYVFLASNELRLVATEVDAAQVMTMLSASDIDDAAFSAWLLKNRESM